MNPPHGPPLRRGLESHFGSLAWCAAALALAAGASLFLLSQKLQRCDDAYITFRHARHFAEHLRPSWNLTGQPVLGSTSPAFMFLLGGLGAVFGVERVDYAALGLNAALLFAIVVLTYLVVRDLTGSGAWALPAAALVGFNSVNVFIFSLGFEAALLIAVLLASLYLARRGHDASALALASLAPLVRPEGLLLSPLAWGVVVFSGRFRARLLAAYLVVPLAWIAFSSRYYGTPVPEPIRSREMRPAVFAPYAGGKVDLAQRLLHLGPHTLEFARGEAASYLFAGFKFARHRETGGLGPGWVLLLGLPAVAVWAWRRRDARVAYLLYAPLFLVLYAWIGYREAWYLPSFVTFALVLLWQGAFVTVRRLAGLAAGWLSPRAILGCEALAAAACFGLLSAGSNYEWNGGRFEYKGPVFARDPRGPLFEQHEIERFRNYRNAAKLLNRSQPQPLPAMTSEVGVFGFFYRGDVIDTVGLCTPEALGYYPPPLSDIRRPDGRLWSDSNNLTPTRMLAELKPAYVVNARGYIRHLQRPGSPLVERYVEAARVGTAWGDALLIYRRADLPVPDE